MVLVKMTHEEYIKFCKRIANRYLFGLIICTIISIFCSIILAYGKAPLISYLVIATGFGISVIGLGTGFIHWRYGMPLELE